MKKKFDFTNRIIVLAVACFCCFLWGSSAPCIKIGYRMFQIGPTDTASILLFAGIRLFLAGFFVIAYNSLEGRHWLRPQKGSGAAIASLALVQTIMQYLFYYMGLTHASGVHTAILTGTNVFFSMLCASLVFRYEKLDARKLGGCALGFLGIVIVNMAALGSETSFSISFFGEGLVLAAQICYAVSMSLIKRYSGSFDVVALSGYQFMAGGTVLLLIGAACGGRLPLEAGIPAFLLLLYMSASIAISHTLWSVLLKHNPVSRISVYGFMNPVFGVVLAAVFLRESGQILNWNTLAALVLVCLGIYVVNKDKR